MRSGMNAFYHMRKPRNLFDTMKIDFHNILRWFPAYKDEDEQEYLRSKAQRREQMVNFRLISLES